MSVKEFFQTKMALGSDITLVLALQQGQGYAEQLFADLWRRIFVFESKFSRFLPASELSSFNRRAGLKTNISPEFRALLIAAKDIALCSNGLFNPFILPALQRAGYSQTFVDKYQSDVADDYSKRFVVPAEALQIGDNWAQIPFATALDMGGCGKGYLADQLASWLPKDVAGFWFSLGGDIVAGGLSAAGAPWTVRIQNAHNPENLCDQIIQGTVQRFAVATSGTSVRKGQHNGKKWHHIIDPRTNAPAVTDILLATVHAKTALQADVFASCAVIVGSEESEPLLRAQKVESAVLQLGRPKYSVKTFGKSVQQNIVTKETVYA